MKRLFMKKMKLLLMPYCLCLALCATGANAFTVMNSRELGRGDARNQNVTVRCTTPDGRVSSQTCQLRRYIRCEGTNCGGWQMWQDLRNPGGPGFDEWRTAASACCNAMGLR